MNKIDRLKAEIRQSHMGLALEAGADAQSAEQSADKLIQDFENCTPYNNGKPSEAEKNYRGQIDAWYASGPVCSNDTAAQIAWLKENADEAVLHAAASNLNIGDDFEVLSWVLGQQRTSLSSAGFQLVAYVTAGCLEYNLPDRPLMKDVAYRIRTGFYRGEAGLANGKLHGESDRQRYLKAIADDADKKAWAVPDQTFGPFPETSEPISRYIFEGGEIRISFEEWQKSRR